MNTNPFSLLDDTLVDNLITQFDQTLKTLMPGSVTPSRDNPATAEEDSNLTPVERKHVAGLMRVNHTGEVCAQALYHGAALTADTDVVKHSMRHAASEEIDHLSWCEERLRDMNSGPSVLNPLWYSISFGVGAATGLAGDDWSLGFVAETEHQVCRHLDDHLARLPGHDAKSRAILEQMMVDEGRHAVNAEDAGARSLPEPIKMGMSLMAAVMKKTAYRL